jgi:hypothetical protein
MAEDETNTLGATVCTGGATTKEREVLVTAYESESVTFTDTEVVPAWVGVHEKLAEVEEHPGGRFHA